jgi:hypothetical protein
MSQPVIKDIPYSNCLLVSPEDILMCRCARKKADWYVSRGLGVVISEDPYTVKLTFTPNGLGNHGDDFYLSPRENNCVVCGTKEDLTRHHCVPYCFRRHFPENYKSHTSHDVLLVCESCHRRYEIEATRIKSDMVRPVGRDSEVENQTRREWFAWKAARAITMHLDNLDGERFEKLFERLEDYFGEDFTAEEVHDFANQPTPLMTIFYDWEGYVAQLADLNDFIRFWRQHFVDFMNPKFLPDHWSVDGRYSR